MSPTRPTSFRSSAAASQLRSSGCSRRSRCSFSSGPSFRLWPCSARAAGEPAACTAARPGGHAQLVPEIENVNCSGRRFGPDSRLLPETANTSYFDATYSILAAWNLTRYRAVMVLDSDLAVRKSLDHVLFAMLARPEMPGAHARGVPGRHRRSPWRGNFFNTGVGGAAFEEVFGGGALSAALGRRASVRHRHPNRRQFSAGVGSIRQFDPQNSDPGSDREGRMTLELLRGNLRQVQGRAMAERRRIFQDPRMRPWRSAAPRRIQPQANIGPQSCLRRHRHPRPEGKLRGTGAAPQPHTYSTACRPRKHALRRARGGNGSSSLISSR